MFISWTFFRATSLTEAIEWLKVMFGIGQSDSAIYTVDSFVSAKLIVIMIIGIVTSGIIQMIPKLKKVLYHEEKTYMIEDVLLLVLFGVCIMLLVNDTYNPFIYFKF